ncbi:zinc transporter, ZIP family [Halobiforma haloterrestris]|uniref:Zinc transporter, ZIP family n=1 Tax=Natronobacterium haloterrestre TaxID=148448 RepID=A0A1I1KBW8_NATHA|nr:ZIP family metal transporter [Halobiforma haloterrestris]SFC55573.1 zinc transporter, ZIP family [Halobiforma haloterrestris]
MSTSEIAVVVGVALLAGCATGIGAIPTLYAERVSHRVYDSAVGFAAGIMIGAAVFALIVPGLEYGSPIEIVVGLALGTLFLLVVNAWLPHLHLDDPDEPNQPLEGTGLLRTDGVNGQRLAVEDDMRRALLVGSAVTIHNVPEGLAVGIAFGSGEAGLGFAIATAIAVQNVPDGFAMAVPASRAGISDAKTLLYTTLSGGVPEPIAAAIGFSLVAIVTGLFPVAAGFAAGAMIAVVFRELIPSSHGHGYADTATATFVAGFAVMLVVDTVLAV